MKVLPKLLALLTISLFSFSSYACQSHRAPTTSAVLATHGMVLFGQEKLMAYHLPMFHKIHARQVVFEYTVSPEVKKQLLSFGPDNLLTFVPAPFDLDNFLANPHPLKGDVYLGHFEKDGVVVMSDITLEAPEIIFQNNILKMQSDNLMNQYEIVGTEKDFYFIHLLDGGVQLDQIIKGKTSEKDPLTLYNVINANHVISHNEGVLQEGETSTVIIMKPIPCRARLCKELPYKVEMTSDKVYFADQVF